MTKEVLAVRLLEILTGLSYKKRLQKMIGVPLPERVAELMTGLSEITAPPGLFSALSPFLVAVWEGGPVHITQAKEGEIAMPISRQAKIDIATAVTHTIIAAVAGRVICVTALAFTVAGDVNIILRSDATAISGSMDFGGTDEPRGLTHGIGDNPLKTTVSEAFKMTLSAAVQVSGYLTYHLE